MDNDGRVPDATGFGPSRIGWGEVPGVQENGCQCRLCRYDDEFAEHLVFVHADHRSFFEELKERWEATDFDAEWHRGCVGGEEYTVEYCERYDGERAKITRRRRDSGSDRHGEDAPKSAAECEASQSGPKGIAQRRDQ